QSLKESDAIGQLRRAAPSADYARDRAVRADRSQNAIQFATVAVADDDLVAGLVPEHLGHVDELVAAYRDLVAAHVRRVRKKSPYLHARLNSIACHSPSRSCRATSNPAFKNAVFTLSSLAAMMPLTISLPC